MRLSCSGLVKMVSQIEDSVKRGPGDRALELTVSCENRSSKKYKATERF